MLARYFLLLLLFSGCTFFRKTQKADVAPYGTVKINDTLFVDRFEIRNVDWREYVYYKQKFDSLNAYKAFPDTLVWLDSTTVSDPLSQYYFSHPAFNLYPVVGISYEQAKDFCKWRTHVANQGDYFRSKNIHDIENHIQDSFPIDYYYRLPTEAEWEMIASAGIDSASRSFKKYHLKKGFRLYNVKETSDSLRLKKENGTGSFGYTAHAKSFFHFKNDTYNLIGNLAEMVAEKGIAKGGSYMHSYDSSKITVNQIYEKPERWLGFRCVAVRMK
jgi:formylglycine-generating enzyme required for sulfatase activity